MLTAEADIRTEHAATYLARLCGHAGKMGTAGRRVGQRFTAEQGNAFDGVLVAGTAEVGEQAGERAGQAAGEGEHFRVGPAFIHRIGPYGQGRSLSGSSCGHQSGPGTRGRARSASAESAQLTTTRRAS